MSNYPMTDDLCARLTALRDDIAARLADENRDRQMIAEDALAELDAILARVSTRYPRWSGTRADANKLPAPKWFACAVCSHDIAIHREAGCDCRGCDCPQPYGRLLPAEV